MPDSTPAPANPAERLFELALDPMVVCCFDGTVRAANRAAGDLAGCAPQDLIGRGLPALVAPRDRRRVRALLAGLADGRSPDSGTVRVRARHHGGDHCWIEVRINVEREAWL